MASRNAVSIAALSGKLGCNGKEAEGLKRALKAQSPLQQETHLKIYLKLLKSNIDDALEYLADIEPIVEKARFENWLSRINDAT